MLVGCGSTVVENETLLVDEAEDDTLLVVEVEDETLLVVEDTLLISWLVMVVKNDTLLGCGPTVVVNMNKLLSSTNVDKWS